MDLAEVKIDSKLQDSNPLHMWMKGLTPSLIMVCNPTVQYVIYEWLMKRIQSASHPLERNRASALQIFFTSAVAKIGATLLTYPLLVVKSRMQVCASLVETKYVKNGNDDVNADSYIGHIASHNLVAIRV